jgi:heme o synthase
VRRLVSDYWALTKPEVNVLIVITTAAAFWMGTPAGPGVFSWMSLLHTIAGTALVGSGAAVLNQLIERPYDARMRRTAQRPLASGRVAPSHALWFGLALSVIGVAYLAVSTNLLAALLAGLTLGAYVLVYTPLKRITPLCMWVGAVPGAAPPLIGWAAARGQLDPAAWELFAIVFLWQFPHFTPIAWMYRDDYARAGYAVLPSGQARHPFATWSTLAPTIMLLVVATLPTASGLSGFTYLGGALAFGAILLLYSAGFARRRTNLAARRLLLASVAYLPATFALLALDKR